MKIIENKKIRVTITDEIWESYRPHAEHTSRLRGYSVESEQRGHVLSDAMSMIGNQSESALLENEPGPTFFEIKQRARSNLFYGYLIKNTKYDLKNILGRIQAGQRISHGMQVEVDKANAYASGVLDPLDGDGLVREFTKIEKLKGPAYNRAMKKILLKRGDGTGRQALIEAEKQIRDEIKHEIGYRKQKSVRPGWKIEIICNMDDMPDQIGLCRYQNREEK